MGRIETQGRVRPMGEQDLDQVAGLFLRNFRAGTTFDVAEFKSYVRDVFFDPSRSEEESGSIVYENAEGRVLASIFGMPLQITANGRIHDGRLMSFFMKDVQVTSKAIWSMCMQMRPKRHDFCFSDTANVITRKIVLAGGGEELPLQSLKWRRVFRPAAHLGLKAARCLPGRPARMAGAVAGLCDPVLRNADRALVPDNGCDATSHAIEPSRFHRLAQEHLSRFSVHPTWGLAEFEWVLRQARRNKALGRCMIREVADGKGNSIGAYLYFVNLEGYAEVFNILSVCGQENLVVSELLVHCDREGYVAAGGMNQPFLMPPLSQQKYVSFRHRGHFWIITRHQDIIDAVRRNDIYIGGLASEGWNRLMTGFGRQAG